MSGIKELNHNYGCGYYKNGNTVVISVDFANIAVPQSGVVLGTLPPTFRPSINVYSRNGFDNQNGEMMVGISGAVKLYSSSGPFNYGHFTCSYSAWDNFGL